MEDFIARNKARVATTNLAKDRQKKLDRMEIIEIAREKPKPVFSFKEGRTPAREVIRVKDLVIGYDEPLTRTLNFSVERNQKIAIKGVNGLGKSTLLKTLLGHLKPVAGEFFVKEKLVQEYDPKEISLEKIMEKETIQLLMRFVNVYVVIDQKGLLGKVSDKNSPVDKGKDIWDRLYQTKIKL